MIKIGICDDNAKIVSKIKRYVESYDKEKADIRTFKNGEELLAEEEVFDAIFLTNKVIDYEKFEDLG